MNKQINADRRRFANLLARKVARLIKSQRVPPTCDRITRNRGHADCRSRFSVPGWIFERHPAYRDYYIIHETLHCLTGLGDGNVAFHKLEQEVVLKHNGHRLVYGNHYPVKMVELESNFAVCGTYGVPL
jgi:hypothetical protein